MPFLRFSSFQTFCNFPCLLLHFIPVPAVVGACQEPDRAAGKPRTAGRTLGAALEKEDRAIYWKGGAENLNKDVNQSRKSLWTELGNTGPGTSTGTVDFLWCCTTMLFIKITLSEPKASLWFLWMVLIVERHLRKFQSRSRSRSRIPLVLPHNISCLNTFSGIFPYTFTIIYTGVLTPNMSGSIITKQKTQSKPKRKSGITGTRTQKWKKITTSLS